MTRIALVTGANRGLGLETSRQLAQKAWRVILTSRNPVELHVEGLTESRVLDVLDPTSVHALAKALTKDRVNLDVLVHNAGIALDGFDAEIAKRTVDTNFFGVLRVTDAIVPLIRKGGQVVMVSSGVGELAGFSPKIQGLFSNPKLTRNDLIEIMNAFVHDVEAGSHARLGWPSSAYRISKLGLNALTRILAKELAPHGVRVNAVCPGWVRTAMGGRHAERDVPEGARSIVSTILMEDGSGGFYRDGTKLAW
ncbi:MAG: SDR family NAD(P)-dependent oxidoreductase [Deltaproteobacteria bacterium]|nr:SDR family NAD(P)-dependent oxidoreductase [Deltaproteobacteria bacterium]